MHTSIEVNASTVTYFGKSFESMHILKVIRLLNSGVLDYQVFITFFSKTKKTNKKKQNKKKTMSI